ncbi:hypothetical protein NDU88_005240 [Pleurodeles waltl]|uniref:Uncharacterized protein n=1 Tax=Pleurodeles waltl TaxID=8319 RepID=A0AAV7LTB0_PLEWA|nr:hypothetical protein NDU88_005240 [Pleurodeles waltl]
MLPKELRSRPGNNLLNLVSCAVPAPAALIESAPEVPTGIEASTTEQRCGYPEEVLPARTWQHLWAYSFGPGAPAGLRRRERDHTNGLFRDRVHQQWIAGRLEARLPVPPMNSEVCLRDRLVCGQMVAGSG